MGLHLKFGVFFTFWLFLLAVSPILMTISSPLIALDSKATSNESAETENDQIPDSKEEEDRVVDGKYKLKCKYDEMCLSPKNFSNDKLILDVMFSGIGTKFPNPYPDVLNSTFNMIKIENPNYVIPLIYSNRNKDLDEKFKNLEENKLIRLFGTLRYQNYKPAVKKLGMERLYFFEVENFGKNLIDDLRSFSKDISSNDYPLVEFRRIDIQPFKFNESKIKISIPFRDIENRFPAVITKCAGILPEDYFRINSVDLLNIAIIADRRNEKLIDGIINLKIGTMIDVYGVVKKVSDTSRKTVLDEYFIYAIAIEPSPPPVKK